MSEKLTAEVLRAILHTKGGQVLSDTARIEVPNDNLAIHAGSRELGNLIRRATVWAHLTV